MHGGIPYPRATNRASRVQTRKRNTWPHSQPEVDDGEAREHQRDLYMCFIDYKKAFDCVDHERLFVILRDMGVPVHLIVLLRRLYTNQEATVRTEFGETDNIDIGKGVRQGCILSPLLFNIYAENIMREALEEWERGISIGRMVTNLMQTTQHCSLGPRKTWSNLWEESGEPVRKPDYTWM